MYYICHTLEDKCMSSRITSPRQRRRFLRGVPESGTSLSVDSSAVSLTALTSVMTDNRPGDPGGRWTSVLRTKPRCMKGDMRPESGFFFPRTSVMRNVQVSKRLSAPSVVQCGKEVALRSMCIWTQFFVILLLHTNTMDLKWNNHDVI